MENHVTNISCLVGWGCESIYCSVSVKPAPTTVTVLALYILWVMLSGGEAWVTLKQLTLEWGYSECPLCQSPFNIEGGNMCAVVNNHFNCFHNFISGVFKVSYSLVFTFYMQGCFFRIIMKCMVVFLVHSYLICRPVRGRSVHPLPMMYCWPGTWNGTSLILHCTLPHLL